MTSPNIVAIGTVIGLTTVAADVGTSEVVLLDSGTGVNHVFKVNNIIAANTTATSANLTVSWRATSGGGGTRYKMANATPVAAYSTLVVLDKASAIYLEENKSLTVESSAATSFDVVCSYEKLQ